MSGVAYARWKNWLVRHVDGLSAFDALVDMTPVTPVSYPASGNGERVIAPFSFAPLSQLVMASEFTLTALPADGDTVAVLSSGDTTSTTDTTPECCILIGRSGSSYTVSVGLGNGNSASGPRFPLPSAPPIDTLLRIIVRFPVAGANAGVAYHADQSAYTLGAVLSLTGYADINSSAAGFFDVTDTACDGVVQRIVTNLGLYSAVLPGVVHGVGWAHIGTNGFVAGDVAEFVANGAVPPPPPSEPNNPTSVAFSNITNTGMDVAVQMAADGQNPSAAALYKRIPPATAWGLVESKAATLGALITFSVTGLAPGTQYEWQAEAANVVGPSGRTTTVLQGTANYTTGGGGALSGGDSPLVILTTNLSSVTSKGSIVLTASITDPTGIDTATWLMNGADIGVSNIGAAGSVVAISVARAILFADSRSNGTVAFQVRAEDTDGNSSLSNTVTVTVSLGSAMTDITTGLGAEMEIQRRDTSRAILFSLFTPLGAALHGAVPSISLVKAGAMGFNNSAAQAATGVCAEVGTSGLYAYIPSEDDINTEGRLIIYPAATGAAPVAPIQAVVVTPYGAR